MKQTITIECASKKEARYVLEQALRYQRSFLAFNGSHWSKKDLKELLALKRGPITINTINLKEAKHGKRTSHKETKRD